jgi:hypothetical protein
MEKLIFTLILIFSCLLNNLKSQDTTLSKVYFYASKKSAIVRLDSLKIDLSTNPHKIHKGTYILKAWNRGTELFIDTVKIAQPIQMVKIDLVPTPEFKKYRSQLFFYKTKVLFYRYLIPAGMITYSVLSTKSISKSLKEEQTKIDYYYTETLKAKEEYEKALSSSSIEELEAKFNSHKNNYDKSVDKYNKLVTRQTLNFVFIGVGLATSAYLIYRSFKMKKPVFSQSKLLSKTRILLDTDLQFKHGITFQYHF